MRVLRKMHRHRRSGGTGFAKDDSGSSTIEFVLWVPIFVLILGLVIDVSFYFLAQSRMFDVAADASRRWAIGSMTQAEAEAFAVQNASFKSVAAVATGSSANGAVTMTITMQSSDVAVTGVINFLASDQMTASVTQLKEGL